MTSRAAASIWLVLVLDFDFSHPALAEPWQALGPEGGAVVTLARDPAEPNRVLVTGDGGFFLSVDGGATWAAAGQGLPALAATALAFDPSASQNVWVGTEGAGVFLSVDGGASFSAAGLPLEDVHSLWVDPADSGTVIAGLLAGAERTQSGGASWAPIAGGLPTVTISRLVGAADGKIYAATAAGAIFRSEDGGDSWVSASSGLAGEPIFGLVADPAIGSTLYIAAADGVYATTDGGTWTLANSGLTDTALLGLGLDSQNAARLLVGSELGGVFRSDDGAATWVGANTGMPVAPAVAFSFPASGTADILAGTEGAGIYRSADGDSWTASSSGLHLILAGALVAPTSRRLAIGSVGTGVFTSNDAGATWTDRSANLPSLRISDLAASADDPDLLWVATDGAGVFRSLDGGATWFSAPIAELDVIALERDPVSGTLFAGTDGSGVLRSVDGGATWTASSSGLGNLRVISLSLDPTRLNRLFAGTRGGLFRSLDGGASWASVNSGLGVSRIADVAFSAASELDLWTVGDLGIFRSVNGGSVWTAAAAIPSQSADAVVVDELGGEVWVGSLLDGLLRSSDNGATWQSGELATMPVTRLEITPDGRFFIGAGQGAFLRDLPLFADSFETGDTSGWSLATP